jgi:hypothetical protein
MASQGTGFDSEIDEETCILINGLTTKLIARPDLLGAYVKYLQGIQNQANMTDSAILSMKHSSAE